jgi:hypothetical protein
VIITTTQPRIDHHPNHANANSNASGVRGLQ